MLAGMGKPRDTPSTGDLVRYTISIPSDLRRELRIKEAESGLGTSPLGIMLLRRGLQAEGELTEIITAGVAALRAQRERESQ